VSFTAAADSYDRFMGRYSAPLSPLFADFAGVGAGQRVLDVGCGPGALTSVLADRVGPEHVVAVDPAAQFVEAARARNPGVTVQQASAEQLPFEDDAFDVTVAQLVVHFMADPVAGIREMARATRSGGVVAACVWDHAGGRGPLSTYWDAAHVLDPDARDESGLAGAREGHLTELFAAAGVREIEEVALEIAAEHPTFEEWWEPFTLGVGPAGAFAAGLDAETQARLRELCRERLPEPPFVVRARAWSARGEA
jgi:SAM-dependent methyltransferase